jgi:uncharacterized protein (DUF2384 family)
MRVHKESRRINKRGKAAPTVAPRKPGVGSSLQPMARQMGSVTIVKPTGKGKKAYVHPREPHAREPHGGMFVSKFIKDGLVVVDEVARSFGMSKGQLAQTIGVKPETLHRTKREAAPKTQERVREMLEIVARIADWAGGKEQAMAWYRAEPMPSFGHRTAESLVKEGKAVAVREYLDRVALGGFA